VRDVEVVTLSARDEFVSVVRAGMAVTALVWLYLANNPFPAIPGDSIQRNLLPFQTVIQNRPPEEQLMFRELQVALLEAEMQRASASAWPDPPAMAEEGIEPFAVNPAVKRTRYQWRLLRDGLFTNYLGVPSDPSARAWLLLVQEPDPTAQPEPFVDDEDHERLLTGEILHVSIWSHADGGKVTAVKAVRVPQAEGWIQLYAADRAQSSQSQQSSQDRAQSPQK